MSKGQILLVGGDPDVSRTLQVYLEAHQFLVQKLDRDDEALAACRQSPPDVVILNWNLSDGSGYSLCKQLRGFLDSFILALVPTPERDARLAALEAGADDVKRLPIDIEEIRLGIEKVLRH
jgi:DNA-binding response OmpR family regulator